MGAATRRKKLGVVRQSVDPRRKEAEENFERLRALDAGRVKRAIELWNEHSPFWDDQTFYYERIEDDSLIDAGIYVVCDNGGGKILRPVFRAVLRRSPGC